MAETREIIAVSQTAARQVAEGLQQARNQIGSICGRTVTNEDGEQYVQDGTLQRLEKLAEAHYRQAMAAAGTEVPEGTTVSLPQFAAIKTLAARLAERIELAETDYTSRTVQVPVMVTTPEEEPA